ncbi:MAG: hypothetical protein ABW220_06115 [Burkholderiaceae bacterium]
MIETRYAPQISAKFGLNANNNDRLAPYLAEGQLWNNELASGQLDEKGIEQRVWGNTHNQNVYMASLHQRLEQFEQSPSSANIPAIQKLQEELRAVKASSAGQPWADAFNDELDKFDARADEAIANSQPQ